MEDSKSCLRVLLFPWLAHGHVFPFIQLSKILSNKNFQIYFCSTSVNLDSIKNNSTITDSSIEMVELQLPSMPDLPPEYHTTKNIPPHLMPLLMEAFQNSSSSFHNIVNCIKPDLLVYDSFQPWAAKTAKSQGIPDVHFNTSGATVLSFFHHLYTYRSLDTFPYPAIYLTDYEKRNLVSKGRSIKVKDGDDGKFGFGVFDLSDEIVLMKTSRVMEGKFIDYFSEACNKQIVSVGSLVTLSDKEGNDDSEILRWLDQKEGCSTLYISFGSENYLGKEQMSEIAKGLELTEVNFIWGARLPEGTEASEIEDTLPEGFLDRVKGRGIVETGWAPQCQILAHSSIGGFISHCGWSSIMESLYFAVPILALPLKLEQPLNARTIVEAGVGVEVARDDNGEFNAEGVAEAINKVFVDRGGQGIRCKARELSEKIKKEQEEASDQVVKQLSSICAKTN